ncbi:MAG: ParB family transcriptional regulator, chromosome partitioning protein [Chloroflexota bacterium]|nr:ParB family transcriptional regulator, chromosome partitioning protein [Chloroflexota bacterium]
MTDWMRLDIEPGATPLAAFAFRCTYCNHLIPKPLRSEELGLVSGEPPQPEHIYPYAGCGCGQGRFVIAEVRGADAPSRVPPDEAATDPSGDLHDKVERAEYRKLPVREIRPNPNQPRRFFDREALQSLADSIAAMGLLEDILVRPVPDGYELVLGERRWRATQLAGLDTISAKIVPLSDEEMRRISIVENVQRADLTEVEEAFAYKSFIDQGMRQADVGSVIGKMGDRVAERLKVLSSTYYVEYQDERIRQLGGEIDKLRERLEERTARYDVQVVDQGGLAGALAVGFDLVTALDDSRFVVRRRA